MSENILPKIVQKQPYKIDVEAGKKYSWCSCGLSKIQPFCDGAHKAYKNSDGSSIMKSVSYIADENKTVYFCGCKHSKNGIFCDGSHSSLKND
ncbi:MAG: CDGSH iron-sulfur domain-containing protein [Proteobacteria bacterium]|nr:CDGSH iron-sulfur domain-containing protein [Pseudomonadota bacterium]NCA28175.1 CDGSH iron-sulfur domain-containing protein [Pseudomonadota bacterium]